jgi:NADH-quinone oxidoreductase subunit C
MSAALETLGPAILEKAHGLIATAEMAFGELTLTAPTGTVVEALTLLRDEFAFQQLVDLCGVDYPDRPLRFDVVYHLLSLTQNLRVRLKVQTDEDTPVPSVTPVYPVADWFEREAFDMYGIFFSGHPDLRRLRLPGPSAAQGFPDDRLCRGSLQRRAQAGGL